MGKKSDNGGTLAALGTIAGSKAFQTGTKAVGMVGAAYFVRKDWKDSLKKAKKAKVKNPKKEAFISTFTSTVSLGLWMDAGAGLRKSYQSIMSRSDYQKFEAGTLKKTMAQLMRENDARKAAMSKKNTKKNSQKNREMNRNGALLAKKHGVGLVAKGLDLASKTRYGRLVKWAKTAMDLAQKIKKSKLGESYKAQKTVSSIDKEETKKRTPPQTSKKALEKAKNTGKIWVGKTSKAKGHWRKRAKK